MIITMVAAATIATVVITIAIMIAVAVMIAVAIVGPVVVAAAIAVVTAIAIAHPVLVRCRVVAVGHARVVVVTRAVGVMHHVQGFPGFPVIRLAGRKVDIAQIDEDAGFARLSR